MGLTMALVSGSLFAADAPKKKEPVVPRKAPEFVFNMVGGQQQLLSMYKGKTIVLAFMFTTCPHCQKTAQVLTTVQTEYASKGVQVLGAVFDQAAASHVQEFDTKLHLNYPCGYSQQGPVLDFLQVPPTDPYFVPILVFIDKRGMIRSQYIGDDSFLQKQELNIRIEIDKMLGVGPAVGLAR
jgi:peroxiredoxin